MELVIPKPPRGIFANATGEEAIRSERTPMQAIERIDYTDGINVYLMGASHPRKGFPHPEAMYACNVAKKVLKGSFLDAAIYALKPFYLKEEYLCRCSWEIYKLNTPLTTLVAHVLEYDDAYRYRFQDMASETTREALLKRPLREVLRLISLMSDRDVNGVQKDKYKKIRRIVILASLMPGFRGTFRNVVRRLNLKELQFDEADRYWTSLRPEYDFFGEDYATRRSRITDNIPTYEHN